ncbi:MAG TPA: glycosyltransferase, partial [Alphaproteobacteria bacterium]|nr:glycosyltransferase [Alphaproteobacteria bacterium]
FTLEAMLQNTITYHQRRQAAVAAHTREKDPLISVLMVSDGKNLTGLRRAVASIAAQEKGRFQILLVQTAPFEPGIQNLPAHVKLEVIRAEAGATPLWQGLSNATGDYVAVLEDAYEWFPQHIARLLSAAESGEKFLCSALIEEGQGTAPETAWIGHNENRHFVCQPDLRGKDYKTAMELINPCGFLAARSLFDDRLKEDPQLATGARDYMLLSLMARAMPQQNFAATVLLHKAEQVQTPPALEDVTRTMLRLWRENPRIEKTNMFIDQFAEIGFRMRAWRYETQREEKNGVLCDSLKFCRFDRARLQPAPLPWLREKSFFHMGLGLAGEQPLSLAVNSGDNMQGVAGFVAFPQDENASGPLEFLLVIEFQLEQGQLGLQLLHNQRTLERYSVARRFTPGRYRLELPVYDRLEISGVVIEVFPNTKGQITAITALAEA